MLNEAKRFIELSQGGNSRLGVTRRLYAYMSFPGVGINGREGIQFTKIDRINLDRFSRVLPFSKRTAVLRSFLFAFQLESFPKNAVDRGDRAEMP